jgi:ATP-dependent DNA ligase
MLAHVYEKHGDKITYPAYVQPKLDGIRCIAIKKGDSVTLWSRTRKRITSCPHIEEAIREQLQNYDAILDGELYNHDLKNDFEKIVSAVRKDNPTPEARLVQYHIYDLPSFRGDSALEFKDRRVYMSCFHFQTPLLEVDTSVVTSSNELLEYFKKYRLSGYEGLMVRNRKSTYENKRSYHLQKLKEFDDAEFRIVGVVEGKGKLRGLLGAFMCETEDGTQFEVKMTGDQESTKAFLNNDNLWKGKLLTVQYQGLTGKNKVPRFPVGLRLRDTTF